MAERSSRILLVDDEQAILTLLSFPLRKDGYEVVPAADGIEALNHFAESHFDLVVLDVMMPRLDGLEVCRRLRAASSVPIIMLTAKAEEIDKVLGLELGADDYITKPFSMREFRSRVKAALRRAEMGGPGPLASGSSSQERTEGESSAFALSHEEQPLHAGELSIDFAKRSVRVRGEHVQTTFVEFEIIGALAQSPGRVFTRDMLLSRIWGDSAFRDPRTIDVHIRHLREKLELDAKEPEYLFTVRGVGYRFRDSDE
jgi:DNA-binding response OmpR family regulator